MTRKKIIYFIAGINPTSDEQTEIDKIKNFIDPGYDLSIRSTVKPAYFADSDNIEEADYVAGTVPTTHNALDVFDVVAPKIFAVAPTVSVAALATSQAQIIAVSGQKIDALSIEDVSAANGGSGVATTYASSNAAKATVSVAGLITGVAAGTCTITVTHEYATGKTVTCEIAVSVTA